jgi:regulator of CtrA degradation
MDIPFMNETPEQAIEQGAFVSFGQKLVSSEAFRTLFREGMSLVEETAAYLDGDGREESRKLARAAALAYATESMRLTTRLMQIASWLLIQRAANEGEMNQDQAMQEKQKVKLTTGRSTFSAETFASLPDRLRELVDRTERLQGRVLMLETQIAGKGDEARSNPIESQLALLRTAFAAEA